MDPKAEIYKLCKTKAEFNYQECVKSIIPEHRCLSERFHVLTFCVHEETKRLATTRLSPPRLTPSAPCLPTSPPNHGGSRF